MQIGKPWLKRVGRSKAAYCRHNREAHGRIPWASRSLFVVRLSRSNSRYLYQLLASDAEVPVFFKEPMPGLVFPSQFMSHPLIEGNWNEGKQIKKIGYSPDAFYCRIADH